MEEFIWYPNIEIENSSGIREVSLYTHNLMQRRVFLLDEINTVSANNILTQLLYLQSENDKPVNILINSGGGQVGAGLMLYDIITSMKVEVNMYCIGMAASMAAVLFAAGEKGHRFMLPHSKTMIHEPLMSGGVGGSATSINDISKSIMDTKKLLNEILSKHTGKTAKEIDRITQHDHYMNAIESIDFGICDEICTELP